MIPVVNWKFDISPVTQAIDLARRYSTRTLPVLLASTAYQLASKAQRHTPFVEMATIDAELEVVSVPRLTKKGVPYKSGRKQYLVTEGGLATRIVLARLNPGSHYNKITDHRYALNAENFSPGQGVAGFWKKVEETAQRMVAARHSSTHFLQAGWRDVKLLLKSQFVGKIEGAAIDIDAQVISSTPGSPDLGRVSGNTTGLSGWITIENTVGMDTRWPNLAASRNTALLAHGSGALLLAIDEQAAEMANRYWPRFERELAAEWKKIR